VETQIAPLLEADPWVELVARRDLLDEAPGAGLKARIAGDRRVGELFHAVDLWPSDRRSTRAYDPKDALWKLGVLADFGLDRNDPRVEPLADRLFGSMSSDGTFRHGGFDHTKTYDLRGYPCITHAVTGALGRFGFADDPRLAPAIEQIRATQRPDGGWHPNAKLGRGGPRESEPSCPFGTLQTLRAAVGVGGPLLARVGARAGDYLLDCWVRRKEPYRPVGFGMGTTFARLAYPFATYGILAVIDTLSAVPAVQGDARLGSLVEAVAASGGPEGFRAATASLAWADFDFGQKKAPSPWITALVLRAIRRSAPGSGGRE
jgi:hypothetical protein